MNIQDIPLSRLVPSPANARKTGAATGIEELAASIKAHGLLQNLQVRPGSGGKFEVVAGQRRLAALKRLAKKKVIAKTEEIACHVLSGEDAVEISLAENIMRLPMHPADQYEAFKALADQDKGPEEIAARFGCGTATVKQRLKLASVSPALLDTYRADEMNLDQLMAFTICDDHEAQERLWAELAEWNRHPGTIRRLLTQAHVEANHRRVTFVGIDAYIAVGGHVLRDLFDERHEGYLTDPALLDRLVVEKLERAAETVRAEGWNWVEIAPELDYAALRSFRRIHPERQPIGYEQQEEIDRLSAEYDALAEEHGDDVPDEIAAEFDRLTDRIEQLMQGTEHWNPDDLARAGAFVSIGYQGRATVERGYLRPEDTAGASGTAKPETKRKQSHGNGASFAPLSAALVEDLTAHRTAALRETLAGNPEIALAAIVHALAVKLFYHSFTLETCLALRIEGADLRASAEGIEAGRAMEALAERHQFWQQQLPEASGDLWNWLLSQETGIKLDLLAYCAGCSVNAVRKPHGENGQGRFDHADDLALAVSLDMAQWWQPTGDAYLSRVSKSRILDAVREGVSASAAENLAGLKKETLVPNAEQRLAGTDWLPEMLRLPVIAQAEEDALAA